MKVFLLADLTFGRVTMFRETERDLQTSGRFRDGGGEPESAVLTADSISV